MKSDVINGHVLRRYLACWAVLLASLVAFPTLAFVALPAAWLPDAVAQLLLLWPQYLFVPNGLSREATLGEQTYLHGSATMAAAAFWIVAVGAYVLLTRQLRTWLVLVGLLPFVVLVLAAAMLLLGLGGWGLVLAGP